MATVEYTLVNAPYFLQVATGAPLYYSAQNFREFTSALLRRPGILGASQFRVVPTTDIGWSVKVTAGYVNIPGVNAGSQNLGGNYVAYLPTGSADILLPMRPPGSGTRTHKVFAAVFDPLYQGNATVAKIIVSEDTGAGAPDPVGAAGFLQLGTVAMSTGQSNIQTANIVNTAQHGGSGGNGTLVTLANGIANDGFAAGANWLRAKYRDGTVRYSGVIRKADDTAFGNTADIVIGTSPPDLIPARTQYLTGVCSRNVTGAIGTMTWQFTVATNGNLIARVPPGNAPLNLIFDGMTYDLDLN